MIFKKLLKARVIVWAAVTVFMVALLIVVNAWAAPSFGSLLDGVFGGKRAVGTTILNKRRYSTQRHERCRLGR